MVAVALRLVSKYIMWRPAVSGHASTSSVWLRVRHLFGTEQAPEPGIVSAKVRHLV